MKTNKLDQVEQSKELEEQTITSSNKNQKKEPSKEKKENEKVESKKSILAHRIFKTQYFKKEIRKVVKDIKTHYEYTVYQKEQQEKGKLSVYPGNFETSFQKSKFDFYVKYIGAIDRWLEDLNIEIKKHKDSNFSAEYEEIKEKQLLELRTKIVEDFCEDTNQDKEKSSLGKSLATIPTYTVLVDLYNTKEDRQIKETVIDFVLAYNEGYCTELKYYNVENFKQEYNKAQEEILTEKNKYRKLLKD